MRLYLSSFRMGDHPEYLAALAGAPGRSAVVIANALDDAPAGVRRSRVEDELAGLAGMAHFETTRTCSPSGRANPGIPGRVGPPPCPLAVLA
jgi:hypothetical protein